MKKIICKIADLSLEKSFKIDIDHYEPESFKRIIASELNLTIDQFQIDNLPSKHKLLDKSKFYSINISINHLSQDVIFQFPNNEQITISIQYRTKIKDLASFYFQKEKIIYHENSIKFLKFILCGIEIPMDYRILCVPEGSIVYIKETCNLVTIKYRNFQFIFPENELIVNAYTLIEKNLNFLKKNSNLFQIQNTEHEQLSLTEKIKKGKDYIFFTRNFFNVRNVLDRGSTRPYNLDPLTTVHELKSYLALIYEGKDQQLTPDNIIIFDQYKTKVSNPDTALLSIQDNEKMIYFDIDTSINSKQKSSNNQAQEKEENKNQDEIPGKTHDYQNDYAPRWMINFEFEENSQLNFRQRISINTKMREISKMIAEKLHTEDDFKINYREKGINHEIDDDTGIKDIREVIRQKDKDGLLRNYLYVKRQTQKKQRENENMMPKSSIKPKIKEINDNDDVISSPSKSKSETSNDEKQINISKPTKEKIKPTVSPVKVEINENNDKPSPYKQKQKPINDKDKKASKKEIDIDDISLPKEKTVTNQSKNCKSRKETKADDDNSSPKKSKSSFVKESNENDGSDNENNSNSKGKEKSHKYFYQIFTEGNISEIILESNAKVVDLKKIIAKKNNVDNIDNIKIIFAGKDLLNEIVLGTLKIGSTVLYVYIRSTEDLLLMTAKALKF